MATIYIPVWRDYYLTMPATPQDYIVKLGATSIYTGRAYSRPGETYPKVRVNDIAAAYLSQTFPLGADYSVENSDFHPVTTLLQTFKVYEDDGVTQIGDDLVFAYDWSGEGSNNAVAGMQTESGHRPIVAKAFEGMPIILSLFNNAPVAADGDDIVVATDNSTDSPFIYTNPGNYVLGADYWPTDPLGNGETWISWGNVRYALIPSCGIRFVLYYVNAHGCWDSLPLEGKCREGRDYDRRTLGKVYDNSSVLNRGTVNYLNGDVRRWTLRTGWVDALGVSRMHHLIGSTNVYLMDFEKNTAHPVIITDTTLEERKYDDELAPVIYTIGVQEAREGERR